MIGIREGQLRDVTALRVKLQDELGYHEDERERVVGAVKPYLEAVLRGGGDPPQGPRGLTEVPARPDKG